MAFPVVQATVTGRTTASNTTSHAITLPSGIVAGELLLVVFSTDQVPTVTVNTGASGGNWNKLGQASNGSIVTGAIFWKIAEGSDALTLTTSASEQSSHISMRISGAGAVNGTSANGSSTNSNPPSWTTTGSGDNLWVATRSGDSTVVATVAPTTPSTFTNLETIAAAGTGGASTNTARLNSAVATVDPGAFTSASEQWVSYTLAVNPGASGAGSGAVSAQTATGAGLRSVTGSGAGVTSAQTAVGVGERSITGSGSGAVAAQVGEGTGVPPAEIIGSGAGIVATHTGAGVGVRLVTGTGSASVSIQLGSGVGVRTITGSGGGTASVQTGSAIGGGGGPPPQADRGRVTLASVGRLMNG